MLHYDPQHVLSSMLLETDRSVTYILLKKKYIGIVH